MNLSDVIDRFPDGVRVRVGDPYMPSLDYLGIVHRDNELFIVAPVYTGPRWLAYPFISAEEFGVDGSVVVTVEDIVGQPAQFILSQPLAMTTALKWRLKEMRGAA